MTGTDADKDPDVQDHDPAMDDGTDDHSNWYGEETATFGDRLAGAREAAGLTQSDLADKLGVKTSTLRKWEDDLAEPRANRLQMLAGMLGVSLSWMMTGRGDGPEGPSDAPEISADVRAMLDEMRALRSQMSAAATQLATLEKRLRKALTSS